MLLDKAEQKLTDIPFEIEVPDEATRSQVKAIGRLLRIIKYHDTEDAGRKDRFKLKSVRVKKLEPIGDYDSQVLEVITHVEHILYPAMYTTRQVFVGKKGGFAAYHGKKTERHGLMAVYRSSDLSNIGE